MIFAVDPSACSLLKALCTIRLDALSVFDALPNKEDLIVQDICPCSCPDSPGNLTEYVFLCFTVSSKNQQTRKVIFRK